MIKKVTILVLLCLTLFSSGCWNYRGLNEMTMIAGVAIDKDLETGNYLLSFEMMDTSKPIKEQGMTTKLIEAQGKTLFDAARNAKKRTNNKLYFGHMQTLVISQEVARTENLYRIIDWFLRDSEIRETICLVVSQQPTARELLSVQGIGQPISSYEIQKIAEADRQVTASTAYMEMFEIYNILKGKGKDLAVPAIHLVMNNDEPAVEANGAAVFKNGYLVGFLSPEETRAYLYASDAIEGGLLLTVSTQDTGQEDVTLEVRKSKTTRSFTVHDGEITMSINTVTEVYVDEIGEPFDALDPKKIDEIENEAQQKLETKIGDTIHRVQTDYGADIFGFGNMIYKTNPRLWNDLSSDWEETFKSLRVNITSMVIIINTAQLKDTESG